MIYGTYLSHSFFHSIKFDGKSAHLSVHTTIDSVHYDSFTIVLVIMKRFCRADVLIHPKLGDLISRECKLRSFRMKTIAFFKITKSTKIPLKPSK